MKKFSNLLVASFLFLSIASCSSDEESAPTNVITDESGIKIDLDWSAGGTVNDALRDADLDLYVYKDGVRVLKSERASEFERIQFDPNLYADGTYTVAIFLYSTTKNVNYTATVNGVRVSKPYTFTSTFAANDEQRMVDGLTIVKAGSKYTITEAN